MSKTRLGLSGICVPLFLLILAGLAIPARGDEIVLNNGDRITGTINSADKGKISITSPLAGVITVNMADVRTFSTDHPIKIQLVDGNVINTTVAEGPAGQITTGPGVLASQRLPISKIQTVNAPPAAWTGSIVVNGLLAQGDTSSEQLGASVDATRQTDQDLIHLGAAYIYGRQTVNRIESTTEDNWWINGQYDYNFTENLYGYANVRVEKDRILLLDLRLTPGVGVGYQWFDLADFKLRTEAGVAWVYEQFTNVPAPDENVSARVACEASKGFFDDMLTAFTNVQYFPSVQNTSDYLLLTSTGFRVAMTKHMFSELKAEVDYDSHPAPTSHRTDTKYILGVGWTF